MFVDFVIQHDRKKVFKVASLQSKAAAERLCEQDFLADSVIYFEDHRTYRQTYKKSAAVLRIMFHLGAGYRLLYWVFRLVPVGLADFFYDLVARNRYEIFGKKNSCRIPNPNEKSYFLD